MSATAETVRGTIQYLSRDADLAVYHASVGGEDARLEMDGSFENRDIDIRNARLGEPPTLARDGCALVEQRTAVHDFYDQKSIDELYTPEVENLVKQATGAGRVVVFDHTRRSDTVALRKAHSIREPSAVVHNDYTERSGPQRVRDLLGDEAEALLARRFAIVNVWRSMRDAVARWPLAICEAGSVAPEDLVASERRARDRIGEIYLVRFNSAHRWLYFPALQPHEAVLIKTFDSAMDAGARFSVHTAFDDPTSPPDAAPRESIESRAFAFF